MGDKQFFLVAFLLVVAWLLGVIWWSFHLPPTLCDILGFENCNNENEHKENMSCLVTFDFINESIKSAMCFIPEDSEYNYYTGFNTKYYHDKYILNILNTNPELYPYLLGIILSNRISYPSKIFFGD